MTFSLAGQRSSEPLRRSGAPGPPGVVGDVFVVGGAAMAMAYDAARVTRDVDAAFKPHRIVLEEARKVADDLGLPYWWLNEQASVYIPAKKTPAGAGCSIIPDCALLQRHPAHVFAMKARAAGTRTAAASKAPSSGDSRPRHKVTIGCHF